MQVCPIMNKKEFMKSLRLLESLTVLDHQLSGAEYWLPRGTSDRATLYYDPLTTMHREEYILPLQNRDQNLYIYQYRKDQWKNLISVVHVSEEGQSSFPRLAVYSERVPIFLSDLPAISFPDTIFVLKESLIGFQELQSIFGNFEITDRMVGINEEGRVKVWMNSKHELNHPERPLISTERKDGQHRMMDSLFETVAKHTGYLGEYLWFQYSKPPNMTFDTALNFIYECIDKHGLQMPPGLSHHLPKLLPLQPSKKDQRSNLNFNPLSITRSIHHNNYDIRRSFTLPLTSELHLTLKGKNPQDRLLSSTSRKMLNGFDKNSTDSECLRHTVGVVQVHDSARTQSHWKITDIKKKTKYFESKLSLNQRLESPGKEKSITKLSWTSNDLSFKSTIHSQKAKKSFLKKETAPQVKCQTRKDRLREFEHSSSDYEDFRTSPYADARVLQTDPLDRSLSHHRNIYTSSFSATKSVLVENKDSQIRQFHNPESKAIPTNRDAHPFTPKTLEVSSSSSSNPNNNSLSSTLTNRTKSLSSLSQFKSIKKSVIRDNPRLETRTKGIRMISQMKTSLFNKIDDLKESEIISELNQASSEFGSNPPSPLLRKVKADDFQTPSTFKLLGLTREVSSDTVVWPSSPPASQSRSFILREIREADGQ